MVTRFNPPNRNQLATLSGGDSRLLKSLQMLFDVAGSDVATLQEDLDAAKLQIATNASAIAANAASVAANAASIATNASAIATNADGVSANAARIKRNEVISWLSI